MKHLLLCLLIIFFNDMAVSSPVNDRNYARIVCQEGDAQMRPLNRVVIIEQLDASEEDGKDLINPRKFYNSKEVPFAVTIYENASLTVPGKKLDEIVHDLKNRQKQPDYIGVATHNGREINFIYNRQEVRIRMELSAMDTVSLFRPSDAFPMSCKNPSTFQREQSSSDDGVVDEVCDLGKDPDCVPIVEE